MAYSPRRLAGMLVLGALLIAATLVDRLGLPSAPSAPTIRAERGISVPSLQLLAVSRGLGANERKYWPARDAGGRLRASVTPGGVSASFSRAGVVVAAPGGSAGFSLTRMQRGPRSVAFAASAPSARGNTVAFRRAPDVVEWYANGPLGLEQGLTLATRPLSAAGAAPLTFSYALSGALHPSRRDGTLWFLSADGTPELRWLGLYASDARGRPLPAIYTVRASRLAISVDDRGARYPITVDPLVQVATLTGSDAATGDQFGFSVAESGSLLAVGAPGSFTSSGPTGNGAVYVFVKPASGWANASQTAKLTASDGTLFDQLGASVAISGTTILAGAPNKKVGSNTNQGAVYVFNQPAGGWVSGHQSGELTTTGGATGASLGTGLVATASTAFASAPFGSGSGKVYVFNKPSSGWATGHESAVLTSSDPGANALGWSLALSGTTLAAGAPGSQIGTNAGQGAVYEFTQPTSGWATGTQTARLVASDGAANYYFGRHVAVGGNGSTIAAGDSIAPQGTNLNQGEAYVFAEPTSGWASGTQSARLLATDGGANHYFGYSVAVSGDGTTVYVGAGNSHGLYRFVEPTGGWSDLSQAAEAAYQTASAFSLAISGTDIIEGADNGAAGQVNLFTDQAPPPPQPTLTVSIAGAGAGTVSGSGISCPGTCSRSYAQGTAVSLAAAVAAGSQFAGWSGACTGTGACGVTMGSDEAVTATFTKTPAPTCTLTASRRVAVRKAKKHKGTQHRTIRAGRLKVTAKCNQNVTATVKGTVTEHLRKHGKHKKQSKSFKLATVHASLIAGIAKTLTLKVPASLVRALEHGVRESAALKLIATDGNGTTENTAKISRLKR